MPEGGCFLLLVLLATTLDSIGAVFLSLSSLSTKLSMYAMSLFRLIEFLYSSTLPMSVFIQIQSRFIHMSLVKSATRQHAANMWATRCFTSDEKQCLLTVFVKICQNFDYRILNDFFSFFVHQQYQTIQTTVHINSLSSLL